MMCPFLSPPWQQGLGKGETERKQVYLRPAHVGRRSANLCKKIFPNLRQGCNFSRPQLALWVSLYIHLVYSSKTHTLQLKLEKHARAVKKKRNNGAKTNGQDARESLGHRWEPCCRYNRKDRRVRAWGHQKASQEPKVAQVSPASLLFRARKCHPSHGWLQGESRWWLCKRYLLPVLPIMNFVMGGQVNCLTPGLAT